MRSPAPTGSGDSPDNSPDNSALASVLDALRTGGVSALADHRSELWAYRDTLALIAPDELTRNAALAYWMNLYNAGALDLAAEAAQTGHETVLRVGRGFQRGWTTVAAEDLSLDDIEHGKIRRFKDPRIHGGLVCGSASCPTLRYEPFRSEDVDEQLDDQMRSFLAGGGAFKDPASGRLLLSRIFLWYGADFTRPTRMPTILPARKAAIADALGRWMPPELEAWRVTEGPRVAFQSYDWSLACTIR